MDLYNKYRPSKFSEVIGQEHITKLIEYQIKNNTLPHCIVLYGPPGVGKTTVARLISHSLNPSQHGTLEKDSAIDGGKDNIKATQIDLYNMPFSGNYKTIIYDEAHNISRAGFDSLLKITEEAPNHVKFIFVTSEFDKIPLSIKSRSTSYPFNRIKNTSIKQRLDQILIQENIDTSDEEFSLVLQAGSGSLRNAIVALQSIVNQKEAGLPLEGLPSLLGILGSKKLGDFVVANLQKDFEKLNSMISFLYPDKGDSQRLVSELQQYLMDLRIALLIPETTDEVKSDISDTLNYIFDKVKHSKDQTQALRSIGHSLDSLYDLSISLESDLKHTANKEAMFTRFLIRIAQSWAK